MVFPGFTPPKFPPPQSPVSMPSLFHFRKQAIKKQANQIKQQKITETVKETQICMYTFTCTHTHTHTIYNTQSIKHKIRNYNT